MNKSDVDKIHTKLHPYKWGCWCCMKKGGWFKPFLRRQLRRKLKNMLAREVEHQ